MNLVLESTKAVCGLLKEKGRKYDSYRDHGTFDMTWVVTTIGNFAWREAQLLGRASVRTPVSDR